MVKFICVLFLVFSFQSAYCQSTVSNFYIEPNVSFSFDTTIIKYRNHFSNENPKGVAYSFTSYNLPSRSAFIYIESKIYTRSSDMFSTDSLMKLAINRINNLKNDTVSSVLKATSLNYKGFNGYGKVIKFKEEKKYLISFYCEKIYDGKIYGVFYSSTSDVKIKNYNQDYSMLTSIIDSLHFNDRIETNIKDSIFINSIKLSVDSIEPPKDFNPYFPATYYGNVKINNCNGKIIKVIVQSSYMEHVFTPVKNSETYIFTYHSTSGWIDVNCWLVIENELGKRFQIPFKFRYYNK